MVGNVVFSSNSSTLLTPSSIACVISSVFNVSVLRYTSSLLAFVLNPLYTAPLVINLLLLTVPPSVVS